MRFLLTASILCSAVAATVLLVPHDDLSAASPKGLDNVRSGNTINSTISELSDFAEEIISATAVADRPSVANHTLPGLERLSDAIGGQRISRGMMAHLKKMEKTNFGARMVCPKYGRGHIYFLDSFPQDGEQYVYHLQTPWLMFYPDKLKDRLREQGFRVVEGHGGLICDIWDPLFSVTALGVKRASVELNWWPETNEAPIQRTRPWVLQDWQTIQYILETTYPVAEIMATVLFSIVGGVLFVMLMHFLWRCLVRKYGSRLGRQDYWEWRRGWIQRGGQPAAQPV